MKFDKMKLGKSGKADITSKMSNLTAILVLLGIISFLGIVFISTFAPLVQKNAQLGVNESLARNNTFVANLWGIFATEGIFEILAVSSYIILIVIIFLLTTGISTDN